MTEQNKQVRRLDFLLAAALVLGALVLAGISLWIPSHFQAPMNAEMEGVVDDIAVGYEDTRMTLRLEGNAIRYTMMLGDYEALPETPAVGQSVILKYDITPDRYLRGITLIDENGSENDVYLAENPVAVARERWQAAALAAYGVYFLLCVLVYRSKKKKIA